jgi:hypothetical protein
MHLKQILLVTDLGRVSSGYAEIAFALSCSRDSTYVTKMVVVASSLPFGLPLRLKHLFRPLTRWLNRYILGKPDDEQRVEMAKHAYALSCDAETEGARKRWCDVVEPHHNQSKMGTSPSTPYVKI